MARISVVVPAYDVEPYLAECLQSIARQTEPDLEVIVVDDGSRDGSAAIAERFAAQDGRFRVVRQANHGLGHARNTGIDAAGSPFLAFVDSDDVVPPDAYARMLASLARTGSDFACGGVRRLTPRGLAPARFLSEVFARSRPATHVSRFHPLISDRTAWNKLFRRTFWDGHELRFPEGVVHEDIPVMVPAHFMARAVDVLAAPVYWWRVRSEDEERSITQRRLELRVLENRLTAVEQVLAHLAEHGPPGAVRWYQERLVADDLRLHMDLLADAGDDYRTVFTERVNALLAGAPDSVFETRPAADRLMWRLLHADRLDELVEVVRFHRYGDPTDRPPVRRLWRWYGDYPYRREVRPRVPRHVLRLRRADLELALQVVLEAAEVDEGRLRIRGHAAIAGLGAPEPSSQRLGFRAIDPGGRLGGRVGGVRLPATPQRRPDLGAARAAAGFELMIDPARLSSGPLELCVDCRSRGVWRRRTRFETRDLPGRWRLRTAAGPKLEVLTTADGALRFVPREHWAELATFRVDPGRDLLLDARARLPARAEPELELRRISDGLAVSVPARASDDRDRLRARVPLDLVRGAPLSPRRLAEGDGMVETWELAVLAEGARLPLELEGLTPASCSGLTLEATALGDAVLREGRRAPERLALPRLRHEARKRAV